MKSSKRAAFYLCAVLLASCTTIAPASVPSPVPTDTAAPESTSTASPAPSETAAPTPLPSVTPAPATPTPVFAICSPLEGIALEELGQSDLFKNPFQQPRAGMDNGHHGVDFAYWTHGDRTTMLGLPIYSVLSGRVAGVIVDRPPYGNAVIVETPLENIPAGVLESLAIPSPAPTIVPAPNLVCPQDTTDYAGAGRSLYLLYAHMNKAPELTVGQALGCGDTIGEVGTSGKSVNYHLHLEARAGPSGAVFPSMAHYETAATDAERSVYCTWRVSGLFAMFDPMILLDSSAAALQP